MLLGATAAAAWFSVSAGSFAPIVRIGTATLVQGLAAGLLAALAFFAIQVVLTLFVPSFRSQFLPFIGRIYAGTIYSLIGAVIAAVVTEEVLLRGLLFGYIERTSAAAAFTVNAIGCAILWSRSWRQPWPMAIKAIEGTVFALIFWSSRSLFSVIVAHAVADAAGAAVYAGRQAALTEKTADWIADEVMNRFGIKLKRRSRGR